VAKLKRLTVFFALLFSVVTVLGFCNSVVVDFDMPPQWQYQWCISLCIQISDVTIIEIKIEIVILRHRFPAGNVILLLITCFSVHHGDPTPARSYN